MVVSTGVVMILTGFSPIWERWGLFEELAPPPQARGVNRTTGPSGDIRFHMIPPVHLSPVAERTGALGTGFRVHRYILPPVSECTGALLRRFR